jgi:peroxiredoxin
MNVRNALTTMALICVLMPVQSAALRAAGREAPAFTARDLISGEELSLAQYRGHPVVLDFWASWCGPCWRSFPLLDRLHESYHERGLVILTVSVDEEVDDARRFAARSPHGFRLLHDPGGKIADSYRVDAMPRVFLIDADGSIRGDFEGFSAVVEQRLDAAVRAHMERERSPAAAGS